ncbi:hypothetical protein ACFL08_00035 [Patescibacteria group bacterium]
MSSVDERIDFSDGDSLCWRRCSSLQRNRMQSDHIKKYGKKVTAMTVISIPEDQQKYSGHHQKIVISGKNGMVKCKGGSPIFFSGIWFEKC